MFRFNSSLDCSNAASAIQLFRNAKLIQDPHIVAHKLASCKQLFNGRFMFAGRPDGFKNQEIAILSGNDLSGMPVFHLDSKTMKFGCERNRLGCAGQRVS
jgi:hypothetical protein